MSSIQSDIIEEMNKLVRKSGSNGLKLLFMFKIIKKRFIEYLEEQKIQLTEEEINKLCINFSKKLFDKNKKPLNEEKIREGIEQIIKELSIEEKKDVDILRARSGYGIITGRKIKAKVRGNAKVTGKRIKAKVQTRVGA